MAVQVVVGRAGTGKTALCLNAIRDRLRADAAEGNHLIFLVPEQAAFQMERALIETPDVPGYARCDVLSFRRLARRVLNEAGGASHHEEVGAGGPSCGARVAVGQPMGSMGRLMAVKLLLKRLEPDLVALRGAAAGAPGFLGQLAHELDEWLAEDLEPERLRELADAARTGAAGDPLAAGRLGDLYRIYTAYREFLAAGHLDPAQELAVAEAMAEHVRWLHGAEIWVDGFAGFTALERAMLVRLARLAGTVVVTLLIDPASPVLARDDAKPSRFSLFSRTERTFVLLREAFRSAGIAWLPPVRLSPSPVPRFASSELAAIEQRVFCSARAADRRAEADESGVVGTHTPADSGRIAVAEEDPRRWPLPPKGCVRLVAAANRRVEVDAAVAEIQRLIRRSEGRLRYRDIAVIVRDLEPYHDLLSAALNAHRIPFFIDRRRRTAHHPLVELLRALPSLVRRDFSLEDVRLLLKTGLLPLDDGEADALENYAVAHGIAGATAWMSSRDWSFRRIFTRRDAEDELSEPEKAELERINRSRWRLLEPLRDWVAFAAPPRASTGRQWADAIRRALDALQAEARIERWAEQAVADGRTEEADEHRQVWRDAMELLDEFVEGLGNVPLAGDEFSAVLDAAMAEFTLGLAPPTLDQVLVGSIERSRHPELAAVLLLGFNDGLFPYTPAENVILTDADRDALAERRPPVGTTRRQRILDERMLAYIAFTRPSRTLWISYPRADESGKPLRPSPFVEDLKAALPGLTAENLDDPVPKRALWPIGRVRELGARLALEFRMRPERAADDDSAVRARWNELLRHACGEAYAHDVAPILASLAYENDVRLAPDDAELLYGGSTTFSASRIETFAACPFKYFAEYGLKLEPRAEFVIEAVDFGLLHHKVLEELFAELIQEDRGLADIELDEVGQRLLRLSAQWTARLTDEALLEDARNAFLLDRSNRHLKEALGRLRRMAELGSLRPRAVEWSFGLSRKHGEPPSVPPVEITTPAGRRIRLVGKIDRVDLLDLEAECLGVVLDYKARGRTMPLWKVYHGLDIQLLMYLVALLQRGETLAGRPIRPIGAFYVPLLSGRQSVHHPSDVKGEAAPMETGVKPRGMLEYEAVGRLDRALAPGKRSDVYSVRINNDGGLARDSYSDAYVRPDMDRVIAFARQKIGELADRILDGAVEVSPYRSNKLMPCSYCEFRAVCRFDHDVNEPRDLASMKREQAIALMGGEGNNT